jgi:murein DD-endopeptidase MepM/ murein hydrolase activator NlpD
MPVVPRRSGAKLFVTVVLLLVVAVVAGVSYLGWRQTVPGVSASATPPKFMGHKTPIAVTVDAARGRVSTAEVRVVQGDKRVVVARYDGPPAPRVQLGTTVDASAVGLREGAATIEVWGRDDFWRPLWRQGDRAAASYPVTLDLTPPAIEIVRATPYIAPGGAGLVVFKVTGAARVETRVGTLTFPTFEPGAPGVRVGFFALPWDMPAGTPIGVSAQDEAGNVAVRPIAAEVLPRKFRRDTIEIRDSFLQAKVPELLPQHPPSTPLIEGFLVINRDQRRQAEEEKRRVAAKTADKVLWEGAFVQPRNTKVFSNFAETRIYMYQGREIDTQVHFGFDLASTRQASVPAANKGTVAYAAPLTIYGNTVILDHGLGLMTLYGHLSSIGVKVGDAIEKGQEIGRSGATGLAIGDHLHYEVLVHGVSVTPLEWWDAKWIRDRIDGPLRAGGLSGIAGLEGPRSSGESSVVPVRARVRRAR